MHLNVFAVQLVIALGTIYRQSSGNLYLKQTLRSLVRHIHEDERANVTILVFAADFNASARENVLRYSVGGARTGRGEVGWVICGGKEGKDRNSLCPYR